MAVLIEAISVVVRRDAIKARYPGGWRGFLAIVPNTTLCFDDELARVGFMTPLDTEAFVWQLEDDGLTFIHNGQAVDIAVVDQLRGPTIPSYWLEFARTSPFGTTGRKVAACWLFEGPRVAVGIHLPAKAMSIATPDGWTYEKSLSANSQFVANEDMQDRLKFLRHEDGNDIYLDLATGKEAFVGRSTS